MSGRVVGEQPTLSLTLLIVLTLAQLTHCAVGTQDEDDVDVAEASSITQLDSCTVQVDPPMTAAMERLRLPDNLMKQLNIVADLTPTGLVLTGELNRVVGTEKCSSLLVPEDLQTFRFIFTGFRKLRSDSRQSDIKSVATTVGGVA